MAILSVANFLKFFDTERIKQLASERSTASNKLLYDVTIVQLMIDQADAFVKEILSSLYTVAEIEVETAMQYVTACIAMYYLERRRLGKITASVKTLYDEAVEHLQELVDGKTKLTAIAQLLPKGDNTMQTEYLSTGLFDGMINEERVQ